MVSAGIMKTHPPNPSTARHAPVLLPFQGEGCGMGLVCAGAEKPSSNPRPSPEGENQLAVPGAIMGRAPMWNA
jgi:hypothetical protein